MNMHCVLRFDYLQKKAARGGSFFQSNSTKGRQRNAIHLGTDQKRYARSGVLLEEITLVVFMDLGSLLWVRIKTGQRVKKPDPRRGPDPKSKS